MTTARKADKRAAKQQPGENGVSIAGTGSPKTARNRPSHKANA